MGVGQALDEEPNTEEREAVVDLPDSMIPISAFIDMYAGMAENVFLTRFDSPFFLINVIGVRGDDGTGFSVLKAGKSTVLSLLVRFYEAGSGTVELEGTDVRKLPLNDLRGRVVYVQQDAPVLAGTVRRNLLYANPNAAAGKRGR